MKKMIVAALIAGIVASGAVSAHGYHPVYRGGHSYAVRPMHRAYHVGHNPWGAFGLGVVVGSVVNGYVTPSPYNYIVVPQSGYYTNVPVYCVTQYGTRYVCGYSQVWVPQQP